MGLFRSKRSTAGDTDGTRTMFFASDLHGSELCFKKFIAAAKFYGADLLILGGDVSGKFVVPLVRTSNGYRARMHGKDVLLRETEVEDFERQAHSGGLYTRRMDPEEYVAFEENPEQVDQLFDDVVAETLKRWIDLAHAKLAGTDIRVVNAPGNDDPPIVDQVIREHGGDRFLFTEGDIVEVAPGHEMLSTGYTNVTPWRTHREYPEEVIRRHLDDMTAQLSNPATAIFNIHVPPHNSRLDTAPLLGQDMTVKTSAGAQVTAAVGSTAVREVIEEQQPLLTLHGHIHESGGSVKIGRTTAINAGSEYGEGILRGVLVTVGGGKLHRYQATSG